MHNTCLVQLQTLFHTWYFLGIYMGFPCLLYANALSITPQHEIVIDYTYSRKLYTFNDRKSCMLYTDVTISVVHGE